jgi:hypothetical protein
VDRCDCEPEPHRTVRIDVTFILPRRLAWLLAGIAAGNLHLPDRLWETARLILQAFHPQL